MTYEELPYDYRSMATDRGWEDDQALAYWQQAKEYREYVIKTLLRKMAHGLAQDDIYVVTTIDDLLMPIRGERVVLT